jgi:hypothetical protein
MLELGTPCGFRHLQDIIERIHPCGYGRGLLYLSCISTKFFKTISSHFKKETGLWELKLLPKVTSQPVTKLGLKTCLQDPWGCVTLSTVLPLWRIRWGAGRVAIVTLKRKYLSQREIAYILQRFSSGDQMAFFFVVLLGYCNITFKKHLKKKNLREM